MEANDKTLCDCGHVAVSNGFSTGYGTDENGKKRCFDCCGKRDRILMKQTGKATLYLSKKNNQYAITNWPGTLSINSRRVITGGHNFAGIRYDVWFELDRETWHGVTYGDNTQLCHCKRLKV
jgi:hypothetical protein